MALNARTIGTAALLATLSVCDSGSDREKLPEVGECAQPENPPSHKEVFYGCVDDLKTQLNGVDMVKGDIRYCWKYASCYQTVMEPDLCQRQAVEEVLQSDDIAEAYPPGRAYPYFESL